MNSISDEPRNIYYKMLIRTRYIVSKMQLYQRFWVFLIVKFIFNRNFNRKSLKWFRSIQYIKIFFNYVQFSRELYSFSIHKYGVYFANINSKRMMVGWFLWNFIEHYFLQKIAQAHISLFVYGSKLLTIITPLLAEIMIERADLEADNKSCVVHFSSFLRIRFMKWKSR